MLPEARNKYVDSNIISTEKRPLLDIGPKSRHSVNFLDFRIQIQTLIWSSVHLLEPMKMFKSYRRNRYLEWGIDLK